MKVVRINDITIRDIFQNTEQNYLNIKRINKILGKFNQVKFDSIEILGGSSFEKILDSNLNMSPFEIVHYIKSKIPSTPLQALIGARNLCGLEVYSKDVIKKFIKQLLKNGIDIFRIYDSLNDMENLKYAISEAVDNGAKSQGTIIYDDLQEVDFYLECAEKFKMLGCNSICIKDVESTMLPQKAAGLFSSLNKKNDLPVYFSSSNLRGLQALNYYESVMNGCRGIDMSFLPSYYNDFNPSGFSFLISLKNSEISDKVDYDKAIELSELIRDNFYDYIRHDLCSTRFILSNTNKNLLPKWLISKISQQLEELGETEALDEVLEEVFKIKNEIGNPSLSTPIGQIIGSQAIINAIISDYRWEIFCDEIKKLILGYFGKLPRKINDKLSKRIGEIMDSSPEKINLEIDDNYDRCAEEIRDLSQDESDILCYCLFPEKTKIFLTEKKNQKIKSGSELTEKLAVHGLNLKNVKTSAQASLNSIDLKKIREITSLVENSNIDEIKLEVGGVKISINSSRHHGMHNLKDSKNRSRNTAEGVPPVDKSPKEGLIEIKSPIVGTFYEATSPDSPPFVKVGDRIKKGDTLCIVEAMKLMNKINSEHSGEIVEIIAANGQTLEFNQTIMILKEYKQKND